MIQIAADIDYLDSRKVRLDPRYNRILLEVAADAEIDLAIVDDELLREFDESETGDGTEIEWVENVRNHENVYDIPTGRHYLLIWNANERREATVAYKITPLDD